MDKKRILFVDDEPNVIDGLRRMLRKQRDAWDMHFASSGAEALLKMREAAFDIIVTDLRMPGMSGAELLEKVRDEYPHTIRIVLSGHADEAQTMRAMRVVHQFLSKPTDSETLKQAVEQACGTQGFVPDERIRAAVGGCEVLPSPPTTFQEINKAVESDTANAKQIAAIISRDVAVSAKILQLVNSSFFGLGRRVSSLEQTVALLGVIRIRALVLGQQILKLFEPPRALRDFNPVAFWQHSLKVAEVARLISRAEGQTGDRPDQAFTAGLLHDIGKLILVSRDMERYAGVLRAALENKEHLWDTETRVITVTHAEIGAYLLGVWGLPARLVEAVALHHDPSKLAYEGMCGVTAVHAADALVSVAQSESAESAAIEQRLDTSHIEKLGLTGRVAAWEELAAQACGRAAEGAAK